MKTPLARRLRRTLGGPEKMARRGGCWRASQFVQSGPSDVNDAVTNSVRVVLAARLRKALKSSYGFIGKFTNVTVSVGYK